MTTPILNKLDSTIVTKSDKEPAKIEVELRERLRRAEKDLNKEHRLREKLEHQMEILHQLVKNKPAPTKNINIGRIGTVGHIGNIGGNATITIDQSTTYNKNYLVAIKELIREIQSQGNWKILIYQSANKTN
jgi:hypothetical protein